MGLLGSRSAPPVVAKTSRYLPTGRSLRGELFVEAKNLLNRRNISGVNRVVTTDASGVPTADITNTTATAVAVPRC